MLRKENVYTAVAKKDQDSEKEVKKKGLACDTLWHFAVASHTQRGIHCL